MQFYGFNLRAQSLDFHKHRKHERWIKLLKGLTIYETYGVFR